MSFSVENEKFNVSPLSVVFRSTGLKCLPNAKVESMWTRISPDFLSAVTSSCKLLTESLLIFNMGMSEAMEISFL